MNGIQDIIDVLERYPNNCLLVTHCERILKCKVELKQVVRDMGRLMDVIQASSAMIADETRRLKLMEAHLDAMDEYVSEMKK